MPAWARRAPRHQTLSCDRQASPATACRLPARSRAAARWSARHARAPERRVGGEGEGGGWPGLKYFDVQVTGGTVWEGIFHSATQSDDAVSIVLNSARVVRGPGPASAAAAVPSQQLEGVVSIKASADDSNGSPAPAFGTDAEIGQRVRARPGQQCTHLGSWQRAAGGSWAMLMLHARRDAGMPGPAPRGGAPRAPRGRCVARLWTEWGRP